MKRQNARRAACALAGAALVAAGALGGAAPARAVGAAPSARHAPKVDTVHYSFSSLADYHTKFSNIYGPLDGAAESYARGAFTASDVPFKPGTDFSVFDHLKYMATSSRTFPAPPNGSITFAADIRATTPGAVDGHVVVGQYGPPGSYDPSNRKVKPYAASTREAQQAAAVLNMIDFCTGQLFDWFVSSHQAFALVERLPTAVTGNTSNPDCPGATDTGLSRIYTQIVKVVPVAPGATHHVTITYTQNAARNTVTYAIDGQAVATLAHVGIPLDRQHYPYTGTWPSLGAGEPLAGKLTDLTIGMGLFSLLDAFPFQFGCAAPTATGPGSCDPATARYSVSIPPEQRSFGQGAVGTWSNITVTTVS